MNERFEASMSRPQLLTSAAGLSALALAPRLARAQRSPEKVNLQLDFLPFGRYAPYYLAVADGSYKARDLDVSIATGTGTGPALQQLIAGRAQIAFVDIASMLVLMGQNPNPVLKSHAVIYAKAPETVFFFEGGPIERPKDLEGKRIATSAGSTDYEIFPLFAAAQGIDPSKIEWVVVDPSAKVGLFLSGKVDATTTFVLGLPDVQAAAKPGQRVGHFTYGDYGVNVYGNGIVTTASFAASRPDIVANFVEVTLRAYEKAFKDPTAAVDAMRKDVPTLKPAVAAQEIKIVQRLAYRPEQRAHGLGYQAPSGMQSTYDAVERTILKHKIAKPVTDFYDNPKPA
jgi:NitT/TauT family transport system substrate-binding protein